MGIIIPTGILVGALEHVFFHSVGNNNPNWRTHIFQRGRLKPPTSISSPIQLLARTQVLSMVLKPVELCLAVNCTYAIMSLVLLLNIYIYIHVYSIWYTILLNHGFIYQQVPLYVILALYPQSSIHITSYTIKCKYIHSSYLFFISMHGFVWYGTSNPGIERICIW